VLDLEILLEKKCRIASSLEEREISQYLIDLYNEY